MIVREEPEALVLVRQADHALLSGWLAAAWGAPPWSRPSPPEGAVLGARLHDLAWTPFDESLPCRADGRPYAFHEVSRTVSTRLYRRGIDAVEAIDPYAGLLVSLHYSGFYVSHWGWRHWAPPGRLEGEEQAAVQGFVSHELERQRRLRDQQGLDRRAEELLRCNYLWLQLWDRISLDVCRYGFAGWSTDYPEVPLSPDPDADLVRLHVELEPGGICRLEPYPLLAEPFSATFPCVRLPLAAVGDTARLRQAWLAGGAEGLSVTFLSL